MGVGSGTTFSFKLKLTAQIKIGRFVLRSEDPSRRWPIGPANAHIYIYIWDLLEPSYNLRTEWKLPR